MDIGFDNGKTREEITTTMIEVMDIKNEHPGVKLCNRMW
jgi:hypothetical protein